MSTAAHEKTWRQPPPGTKIVSSGEVQPGDWFYIESLGAWAPVPKCAIGEHIFPSTLVARGAIDLSQVHQLTP